MRGERKYYSSLKDGYNELTIKAKQCSIKCKYLLNWNFIELILGQNERLAKTLRIF